MWPAYNFHTISLRPRARGRIFFVVSVLVFLIFYICLSPLIFNYRQNESSRGEDHFEREDEEFCGDRFGASYIRKFGESATNYCEESALSRFTCFTHQTHKTKVDSFCIGMPAAVDPYGRSISLHCPLGNWSAHRLENFPYYWYNTGPKAIIEQFIDFDGEGSGGRAADGRFVILVKREEAVDNLWHVLMQVFSLWLSIKTLRSTIDMATLEPFYVESDVERTQVIILDSWKPGPFMEFWGMFGEFSTAQLSDVSYLRSSTVIIPLPGSSNTLWQGDWEEIDCGKSTLLEEFSETVLDHFNISYTPSNELTLTWIDRRTSRKLLRQQSHLASLEKMFPDVKIQIVDFAKMSITAQIEVARSTNILAGVHGAGLGHGFWLRSGSTIVEVQPPNLKFKGFRNMATLLGHNYFTAEASNVNYDGVSGDWHWDDVNVEEERFLALMGDAIRSYNR
ncbi:glycosyltransferase family 61 protein [Acidomyces richmondensis BFW]|nr:glycosyltransferase family 61 protein [Acidomyces richmondensis BFW]